MIAISEIVRFILLAIFLSFLAYFNLQVPDSTEFVEAELVLKDVDFSEYDHGFKHMVVNARQMKQNDRLKLNKSIDVDAIFFNKEDKDFRSYLKSNFAT